MKLSKDTLDVLKNFASINSGIEFKKGNTIRTMSSGKTVLAKATLKDEFPQDFCVYDLNQFLSIHSSSDSTEIDFDEKNVVFIFGPKKSTTYRKTAREMIVTAPDKELSLPSVDITFTLTKEDLADLLKHASLIQSSHVAVESDGETINLSAFNAKDDSANVHKSEIGEGNGKKFKMVFLVDNLKMISGSYDVEISAKGLASFKNKSVDLQYWVATESKESKFEG